MKYKNIKVLKIFTSMVLVLGMTTACSSQKSNEGIDNSEQKITETTPNVDETPSTGQNEEVTENEVIESEDVYKTNKIFHSESELLKHIQSGTDKLKEMSQGETVQHVKDTVIHFGLSLADFILLDEPIGGMRFNELTEKGKEVVFNCLFAVDTIAKEKVPEQYATLKVKIVQIKNKFKDIVIDAIGEENYNYFGELKDKAIDKGKEYYEKGKQYVKDKYQNWREKHSND